jgi:type III pantothenate kinase
MYIIGDIGNSEVKIFIFSSKKKQVKKIVLKTSSINSKNLNKSISSIYKFNKNSKVLFSSVVPNVYKSVKFFFLKKFKIKTIEVKELKLKKFIQIKVNKKQVGSDRLCNAIALTNKKSNFIIIDFGTATTFDVVIKNQYLGGIIAPGVSLSLNTLISNASLIPNLKLKEIRQVLGKNTVSAVRSGFYWGYLGLVENIINKIYKQTKKKYKIVITGGFSSLFSKSLKVDPIIDKDITMKGLQRIIKHI